ncbi:phage tail protein [Spirulina subsalsa FACHB-351]|uniref:Phage tail protein n=1 Tax=Spirulina subsalsa FACHB-351 TaxID=234711 RepID=A0ABT3L8S5_9CYAN|nr:phage tail protein [Spirulina subsalsa]MCW6037557.1 phage tail protein [Spirulina subsalsa FACHB-351]
MENQSQLSSYLEYLPAYLQTDPLIGQFLRAFEQILSGIPSPEAPPFQPHILTADSESTVGVETVISEIHRYFDPQQTPAEFLPWLAGWIALSLQEDWNEAVKRQFISQIVPLYRIRGTVPGLKKMLTIYLENSGLSYPERTISIFEFPDQPHYFQVQLALPSHQVIQPERYWRECRAAQAIINQEKPAHTYYALRILTLTMQLSQGWGCCYPFTLWEDPSQQILELEASVHLDPEEFESQLGQEILIRIQGTKKLLEPKGSQRGPVVRQRIFYDQWVANPRGFFVALANLGDRALRGTLTVHLNFTLNHQPFSCLVLTAPFDLEPNLRIYRPWNDLAAMPGNTRLDSNPATTLKLQNDPPLHIYEPQIQPIDGNIRLGSQRPQTLRLVHDARLRIYQPRTLWDPVAQTTRLGWDTTSTLQLSRDRQTPTLQIYTRRTEYKIGNTRLGPAIGDTLRLVPNSQWLERIYRFQLFELPQQQQLEIEVWVEPHHPTPEEALNINHLLLLRIQSQTAKLSPFPGSYYPNTPNLEFSPQGIRATHTVTYQKFLENLQGFYVVLTNLNPQIVTGTVTIRIKFKLNQRQISLVILEENFALSPRVHALEICHQNQDGTMAGNTIIGRVTPYMLRNAVQTEDWID